MLQDTIRQSPDDVIGIGEGGESKRVGTGVDEDFGDGAAIAEGVDGNPEGSLDLAGIGCGNGVGWNGEDEGSDEDGREAERGGGDLVEGADERAYAAHGDSYLLLCFTAGGGEQVSIAGGATATGERDVSRPGVTRHFGAADEEHFEGIAGPDEDRDGSFAPVGGTDGSPGGTCFECPAESCEAWIIQHTRRVAQGTRPGDAG